MFYNYGVIALVLFVAFCSALFGKYSLESDNNKLSKDFNTYKATHNSLTKDFDNYKATHNSLSKDFDNYKLNHVCSNDDIICQIWNIYDVARDKIHPNEHIFALFGIAVFLALISKCMQS